MLKSATSTNPRFALATLAACAYAVGTTEFVIVGLLPTVARDTHATIASAGLLVSSYALAVTIGTPLLTALTSSFSCKATLLALMAVFILGNIAALALALGYGVLMAARLVTGLAHGLFISVGYMIADDLVPEEQPAGAVALVLTGLTVTVVTGVPLVALQVAHILRASVRQNVQWLNLLLLKEGQNAVVENVGGYKRVLPAIKLGKGHPGGCVDHGLPVDAAHAIKRTNVERVLRH